MTDTLTALSGARHIVLVAIDEDGVSEPSPLRTQKSRPS
jgi:hypothetical protein